MRDFSYHHLRYFWMVAREGGVNAAAKRLHVTQSTVSGLVKQLERDLDRQLFQKRGRNLELTEAGRAVLTYADEIFALGDELAGALGEVGKGRTITLRVGISDMVPKLVSWRLLSPVLELPEAIRLDVIEDKAERLLAELALHHLDLVLIDHAVPPSLGIKAFSHLLAESSLTFCATSKLAVKYRRNFPASLTGAPLLLPGEGSALRRQVDQWLDEEGISPRIVGEFVDSALIKVFGQHGAGIIPVPTLVLEEALKTHDLERLGEVPGITVRFYAISLERRLRHPAVAAIAAAAKAFARR